MKFIRVFIFVALLAVPLWAKISYYILPVQLDGVHEDYIEKIISLTKEYVAIDGDEIVSDKTHCDYLLQIKLIRKEKGVAIIYDKMTPEGNVLWSYGHIVYSPEEFASVASYVTREMDKLSTEWVWGFGFGAIGMIGPVNFVDYNYEPFVRFIAGSVKMETSLNIAYLGSRPKGVHGSVLGASFSVAYMFGHRFVVPYLGAGINGGLVSTEIKKEIENKYGLKEEKTEEESVVTPGYFLEFGLSIKLKNEVHIMLESRYFREFYKMKNILDGAKGVVHGFSVGVKFGV